MFDILNTLNETNTIQTIVTVSSFTIFAIGLIGILTKKNLIKIFLSIAITETSLFLFFIGSHYQFGKVAPILTNDIKIFDENMADPVPQAMILTTIVIAVAILALAMSFITKYQKLAKNIDIDKIQDIK